MVDIKVDTSKVAAYLRDVAARQMPFACAKALTKTAQDAQAEIRRLLPSRFTLRNNFISMGVRITAARKTNLQSSIYSKDDFMTLQETGGSKTPRGRNLAIPTSNVRRNKRDIITKANRPRQLKEHGGYFIGEVKGIMGLWKRPSNKERKGARRNDATAPVRLMFAFKQNAKVPKRWGFEDTAVKVANQKLEAHLNQAINDALR